MSAPKYADPVDNAVDQENNTPSIVSAAGDIPEDHPVARLLIALESSSTQVTTAQFRALPKKQRAQMLDHVSSGYASLSNLCDKTALLKEKIGSRLSAVREALVTATRELGADINSSEDDADNNSDDEESDDSDDEIAGEEDSALVTTLGQLSKLLRIVTSDAYPSLPAEKKRQVADTAQQLIECAKLQLESASPEHKSAFGGLLASAEEAFAHLDVQSGNDNKDTEDTAAGNEEVDMTESMDLLARGFRMLITSMQDGQCSASDKEEILRRVQQIVALNIQLLNRASRKDKEQYLPVISEVVDALKRVTSLDDDADDKKKEEEGNSGGAAADGGDNKGEDAADALQRLMEIYEMVLDPMFQQLPPSSQRETLTIVRNICQVVGQSMASEQNVQLRTRVTVFVGKVMEAVQLIEEMLISSAAAQPPQMQAAGDDDEEEDAVEEAKSDDQKMEAAAADADAPPYGDLGGELTALHDILKKMDAEKITGEESK